MTEAHINSLRKVGVILDGEALRFTPFKEDQEITIQLDSIVSASVVRSRISLMRKILFWTQRILFWNNRLGSAALDGHTEYRYLYDLTFELRDSSSCRKQIQDFDLFGLTSALDQFNKV